MNVLTIITDYEKKWKELSIMLANTNETDYNFKRNEMKAILTKTNKKIKIAKFTASK